MPNVAVSSVNPNITPNFMVNDTKNTNSSVPYYRGNLDYPPDTVQFKGQEVQEKKGLSKGAKWGIGTAVTLGVGALIYVLTRGKAGSATTKQAIGHFKPAKTLEEAKAFAKNNFDVVYSDFDDLEIMNFVNRWLTELQKQGELTGKSYHNLITCNNNIKNCFASHYTGKFEGRNVMGINLSALRNPQSRWEKSLAQIVSKDKNGKYIITAEEYDVPFVRDLVKRISDYNPKKTTIEETVRIYTDIYTISAKNELVNGKLHIPERFGIFHLFNHERGHLLHFEIVPLNTMDKVAVYEKLGKPVPEICKEFAENEQIQDIAHKVSQYAMESPAEFVAETYARLKDGAVFEDDVMALYKKYKGPVVS